MKKLTISITFYSPRELWVKFWNRFFWPRRKECAEWIEILEAKVEYAIIHNIIIDNYNKGLLGDSMAESLELAIKSAIEKECETIKEVMSKPM